MTKRICVYCGSGGGVQEAYAKAARALGQALVTRGFGLVFGGGRIGLMGLLAKSVLEGGGEAIGVIPRNLRDKGLGLADATSLRVVETMHARKALMTELADAFIAMPGGLGTADEFFEALSWAQLGLHMKPCGLFNVHGFFDHLIRFVDHAVSEQFIDPAHRQLLIVDDSPEGLLDKLDSWRPLSIDKAAWAEKLMKTQLL